MKCNKCKHIEMKVEKVEEDKMFFKCKQCGNEEAIDIRTLEKENRKIVGT